MTGSTTFTTGGAPSSRLLGHLERVTVARPFDRKRLVGPDLNFGREALGALARATGGWIGWEATNLRGIAEELAFVPMAERRVRSGNDVEIGALVNQALDQATDAGELSQAVGALGRSLGFRRALTDTILEVRTAGVSAAALRNAVERGSPAHDLPAVLERYERLLEHHALADPAGVFRTALEAFDRESVFVLDGAIMIVPTLGVRGLAGQLVTRLLAHGAQVLDADTPLGVSAPERLLAARFWAPKDGSTSPTVGEQREERSAFAWLEAPTLPSADDPRLVANAVTPDFFVGSTPTEELREVCRRIIAEGVQWDEVEIAATDVDTYGVALDALSQQLRIATTMLHGIPLARTRLGRALDRWLRWLEGGLPATVLRQALEAGELAAPGAEAVPTALARGLRRLRIGWGRARHEDALATLEADTPAVVRPREAETPEEYAERVRSRQRDRADLARLLRALLSTTPEVPELGSQVVVRTTASALARSALGWLAMVPLHDAAEQQTAARLATRLEQLAEIDGNATTFAGALATLREALADLRAWPLHTSERKPWSAGGGMMHLTDLAHAGTTGRHRIFVVGLDAGRMSGSARQDPLLPDPVRIALGSEVMSTSAARRAEARWLGAQSLASLRGRVTLSYAVAGSVDGRESGPSPQLLQAWRIVCGDAALSYEDLRAALGAPACAVPVREAREATVVDARDVWMDAIADGPLLLDADALLSEAFPTLANGLRALERANGPELTPHHGLVPAAAALDPRLRATAISPSALEKLATCPLAWFYRYGLSLLLPDDPEFDPEGWLSDMDRGSLLHEVFEEVIERYRGRQHEILDPSAKDAVLAIVRDRITEWKRAEPPPGEAVFEAERAELERAALSFLAMERDHIAAGDRGTWLHTELAFGGDGPPGTYRLADGTVLSVKGKADRVDRLADGTLRVVDYKTGAPGRYQAKASAGVFNGGRHLQPALYAAVVETLLGATVARFEYRFPTERGENAVVVYDRDELDTARAIVGDLLEHVMHGHFVPTTAGDDCTYCDYQSICRAQSGRYGGSESPRATWAEANAPALEAYRTMLRRRSAGPVS